MSRSRKWRKHHRGTLMELTLDALADRPAEMTYQDIYDNTGISPNWLQRFAAGTIADPGVNRVQVLYEWLTLSEIAPALRHYAAHCEKQDATLTAELRRG